jgi:hypothetical protein
MPYNVKRLCDGGEIEAEKLNLLLMLNQGTNVGFCTKAPLLQNRCYLPFFLGWFVKKIVYKQFKNK